MKIALYSHGWENPLVKAELKTCDMIYTADPMEYRQMAEEFGHHVVHVISNGSLDILAHLKKQHLATAEGSGETVRFVEHADVSELVRRSKPRMTFNGGETEAMAQRDLNWLSEHRHYERAIPGRPAHSSWLLIGPGDCNLAKAVHTLRPPGYYCELDSKTQAADLVRFEWLDSIGYFMPAHAGTPAYTTWMLATAGEVTLRQAVDRMIQDHIINSIKEAA